MFLLGRSTRSVAAFHGLSEAQVDSIKRSEMLMAGVGVRNGIRPQTRLAWARGKAA